MKSGVLSQSTRPPSSFFLIRTIEFHIIHVHMSIWPKFQGDFKAYSWSIFSRLHSSFKYSTRKFQSPPQLLYLISFPSIHQDCYYQFESPILCWSAQNASGRKLGDSGACFMFSPSLKNHRQVIFVVSARRWIIHISFFFLVQFKTYLQWKNYSWDWNSIFFMMTFQSVSALSVWVKEKKSDSKM